MDGAVVSQSPDEIQRDIERTRQELAETFDAIADRVSPKRAVSRTTSKIKSRLSGGEGSELRLDRVAMVAAAILLVAFVVGRWRRHR
jgi:hypothetical protein